MKTLRLRPMGIDRTRATHVLAPERARILQCADILRQAGSLTRCRGAARNEVEASATTVTASHVFERQDCKRILVDGSAGGVVRMTPGRLGNCSGPRPQWQDPALSTGPDSFGLGSVPSGAAIVFELFTAVGSISSTPEPLVIEGILISGTINGNTFEIGGTTGLDSFQSGDGRVEVSADRTRAGGYLGASDSVQMFYRVNGVVLLESEVTMQARYRRMASGLEFLAVPAGGGNAELSLSGAS